MLSLTTRIETIGRIAIGRIGSYNPNLKKFLNTDDFNSSVQKFRVKYSKNGIKIAAMTSISACLLNRAKNDSEDNADKRKDSEEEKGHVIRNLQRIVEIRANHIYNAQNERHFFHGYKPNLSLDWSGVEFIPEVPKYTPIEVGVDGYRVTSETVLENKSIVDQEHKLKAERQTSSVYESVLTEGYIVGSKIGLSFPVPVDLGISGSFTLNRVNRNTDEEKRAWYIEDVIRVPRNSTISVSMVLKEKEIEYSFNTRIGIKGKVKAIFNNKKGKIVGSYAFPMKTLILEEFPKRMIEEKGDITYIKITGRCKFKYGIDKIIINSPDYYIL